VRYSPVCLIDLRVHGRFHPSTPGAVREPTPPQRIRRRSRRGQSADPAGRPTRRGTALASPSDHLGTPARRGGRAGPDRQGPACAGRVRRAHRRDRRLLGLPGEHARRAAREGVRDARHHSGIGGQVRAQVLEPSRAAGGRHGASTLRPGGSRHGRSAASGGGALPDVAQACAVVLLRTGLRSGGLGGVPDGRGPDPAGHPPRRTPLRVHPRPARPAGGDGRGRRPGLPRRGDPQRCPGRGRGVRARRRDHRVRRSRLDQLPGFHQLPAPPVPLGPPRTGTGAPARGVEGGHAAHRLAAGDLQHRVLLRPGHRRHRDPGDQPPPLAGARGALRLRRRRAQPPLHARPRPGRGPGHAGPAGAVRPARRTRPPSATAGARCGTSGWRPPSRGS